MSLPVAPQARCPSLNEMCVNALTSTCGRRAVDLSLPLQSIDAVQYFTWTFFAGLRLSLAAGEAERHVALRRLPAGIDSHVLK